MTKSSDKGGKSGKGGKGGKKTVELPAMTLEDTPGVEGAPEATEATHAEASTASTDTNADEPRVTRELPAIVPQDAATPNASDDASDDASIAATASVDDETGPSAEVSAPSIAAQTVADDDLEATVQRAAVEPPPPERPRLNTLASITRPRGNTNPHGTPPPEPPAPPAPPEPVYANDGILDETGGGDEQEWAIADQPTVALSPGSVLGARPDFLNTYGPAVWPPPADPELPLPGSLPEAAASLRRRAIPRPDRTGLRRFASPGGRPMPETPPAGMPRGALPDPRMERYQELHRRLDGATPDEYDPQADRHVTDRVRQWWSDLRPGLKQALDYQHEARASGVLPIPAYEPAPTSRLGDVFGRLAASARGLTGRAQSAAGPALKRLHDQAEHAAQAIVGRFEGDTARQQAPFLGPGRIAVFFRSGVSVGQAQRLLSSNDARPLRIIPRKHGFLAYVLPGTEEQVSSRLRVHPYIRDVVYMPVDAYGDADDDDMYEQ